MTGAQDPEDWASVGRALTRRAFDDLRLTKAELIRRSGISAKTVSRYLAGEPIVRRDKERALCAAVGWSPDSVERILAGGDPVEAVETEPSKSLQQVVDELVAQVDALEREVAELRARQGN